MPQALVIGSGPNGLATAITLARAGVTVKVLEAAPTPGGGLRSFRNQHYGTLHDHCSAVHPLALISPFFRSIGIQQKIEFASPPTPWAQAHIENPRRTSTLHSVSRQLNRASASFAGVAAHAMLPPAHPLALGTGILLGGTGLINGWKIPLGGSQKIADFLTDTLHSYGGSIDCNRPVDPRHLPDDIETADLVLWDTDARTAAQAANPHAEKRARKYGPGAAKADFVTNAPIPWSDPALQKAGTVHLGGSWADVRRAEQIINRGQLPPHPFVLVSQPSLFDPARAPSGLHTVWAYAHVPHNSAVDPIELITGEIERFAPGFSQTVLHATARKANRFADYNPNYVGGDIASGAMRDWQLFTSGSLRPAGKSPRHPAQKPHATPLRQTLSAAVSLPQRLAASPWTLPRKGWYLCSGTTPPGPGVHGISGYLAAQLALRELQTES